MIDESAWVELGDRLIHTVLPPVKAKTISSSCSSGHGQNLTSYSVDSILQSTDIPQTASQKGGLTSNILRKLENT